MADCNKCIHLPVCSRLIYCLVNEEVVCNHYLETKQATSDENKQWIPVSERLPEVGAGDVLVARIYKGKPYVDVGEFIAGTAYCWGDEYAINPREHITTHWLPLPEPPKEENK